MDNTAPPTTGSTGTAVDTATTGTGGTTTPNGSTAGYDGIETGAMPSSSVMDTDGDGLTDEFERLVGLDPLAIDTDRDGITDGFEITHTRTDPLLADTDADGFSDGAEYVAGTDAGTSSWQASPPPTEPVPPATGPSTPTATAGAATATGGTPPADGTAPTDGAGGAPAPGDPPVIGAPPDPGTTPTDPAAPTGSTDPTAPTGGGTTPTTDSTGGTTPPATDPVGGGAPTGSEQPGTGTPGAEAPAAPTAVTAGDPVATEPAPADTDGDGLSDQYEIDKGFDPAAVDTDGDGLSDGMEVALQTDASLADTDGDGLTDGAELRMGSDPLKAQTPVGTGETPAEETSTEPKVPTDGTDPAQPTGPTPTVEQPVQQAPQQPVVQPEPAVQQVPQQPVVQQVPQQPVVQQVPQQPVVQQVPQQPVVQQVPQQPVVQQVPQQPVVQQVVPPPQLPTPAAGTTVTTVTTQTSATGTVTTVSTSTAAPMAGTTGAATAVTAPAVTTTTAPAETATQPATDPAVAPAPATGSVAEAQAINQKFLDSAQAQLGDTYVFGAEVDVNNPNPTEFDCAELTKWAAHQAGQDIPGSSFEQYLELKAQGLLIPVEDAKNIPGALVFHFSSEPTPGGGRPSEAHVAISRGDGTTIEAKSTKDGVVNAEVGERFEYAAVLPGTMAAATGADAVAIPADSSALGADGKLDYTKLTVDDVMHGIMMQESHGDYKAENPTSTASGAYQYIDGTWNGYGGYSHASDAPKEVQDEKMRADTQAAYDRLGDWERVIASHFAGENVQDGPKSDWGVVPGTAANQNPSIRSYVDGVLGYVAEDQGVQLKAIPSEAAAADGSAGGAGTADDLAAEAAVAGEDGAANFGIDQGAAVTGADADADGLTDDFERMTGTNAAHWDSDLDGLSDGWERAFGTDPLAADSDNDGLTDAFEVQHGGNPLASSLGGATPDVAGSDALGPDLPDVHSDADSGWH